MSRPTFLNPFVRGAEKDGAHDGAADDGAYGLVAPDPSSASGAGLRRTEPFGGPYADFIQDELALALLSSPQRNGLSLLGPPVPPKSSGIDNGAAGASSGSHLSHISTPQDQSGTDAVSRKGSFMLNRRALDPGPLFKKVVDLLRPKDPGELRRKELRALLSQHPGPRHLGVDVSLAPARPPRPASIDPEVLDMMHLFPCPTALSPTQNAAKRVVVVPASQTQHSSTLQLQRSSPNSSSTPCPPPRARRITGSLPVLPHTRQKIGVTPDLRGRPRHRRNAPRDTHWDVLQVNRLRIPATNEGKWISGGVLGQGGFGTVYLVYNVARQQQCAMKIVHYARGMSESSCRGTINELKVLSRLAGEVSSPPFLLQPYVGDELWAWRSAREYLHIVTELCTGGDLSCYQYRLSDSTLSLICAEVILGLDHLHRLGIVHHDIKPQNILVNGHGHCVISDYGGAQFLDASQRIHRKTQRNMAVMTIPFAAPELLSENESVYKTYDRAVDYWALGATLVSLIMDDDYLPGTQDIAMIMFRLRRIEKKMEALSVSEKLQHFIMALLDQSPSRRPKYPEVAELPFLHHIDWEEVQSLRCPPFDYVKEVGVLAHGFSIPTARVHETRAPVDFLPRLRHEQLSLVVDDSYDVAAHRTALEADL